MARAIGDQCDQPEGKVHEQQPTGDRRHQAGTVGTVGVGPKLMTGCPEYDGQCGADSRFFDVQALEKMQRGRGDRKRQSCSPRRSLSPVLPTRQQHVDAHRGRGPGCDAGRGVTHYLGDHCKSLRCAGSSTLIKELTPTSQTTNATARGTFSPLRRDAATHAAPGP